MPTLNQVQIAGHVVRDGELRQTTGGTAVLNFTLALNHKVKKGDQWVDGEPTFIDVTAWGKTAEMAKPHAVKGNLLVVIGKLKQDRWETQDGQKRSKVKVVADQVHAVLREQRASAKPPIEDEDEPPF